MKTLVGGASLGALAIAMSSTPAIAQDAAPAPAQQQAGKQQAAGHALNAAVMLTGIMPGTAGIVAAGLMRTRMTRSSEVLQGFQVSVQIGKLIEVKAEEQPFRHE